MIGLVIRIRKYLWQAKSQLDVVIVLALPYALRYINALLIMDEIESVLGYRRSYNQRKSYLPGTVNIARKLIAKNNFTSCR